MTILEIDINDIKVHCLTMSRRKNKNPKYMVSCTLNVTKKEFERLDLHALNDELRHDTGEK